MPENNRNNLKKENLLASWKEIASYLDCDIRTCHRWENEYGLPIHRMSESSKARVFTTKEELDEWLRSKEKSKADDNQERSRIGSKRWSKTLTVLVSFFVIVVIGFVLIKPFQSNRPADFTIKGSTLVILNEKGKKLWRYDTGLEKLVDEKAYRLHFQFKHDNGARERHLPHLIIKDIDSDDVPEVLFSTQTQGEHGEGELFCFDNKGELLWTFEAGREITFGNKVYSKDFRIKGFDIVDLDNDGLKEIVVISRHNLYFPNQVVILDNEGKIKGEYWNSGYLLDYAFVDLDNDGKKNLIFSGLNNEYETACLIIFNNAELGGFSPQKEEEFKSAQLSRGTEKHYILLPRIEWTLIDSKYESAKVIEVLQNRRLSVVTFFSHIYFEFDFQGQFMDIHFSDYFDLKYKEVFNKGFSSDEDYKQDLLKQVLYHVDGDWLPALSGVGK